MTIPEEEVEAALYAQLCVFRKGYGLKPMSFEEMKDFEVSQDRWQSGVDAMLAALLAAAKVRGAREKNETIELCAKAVREKLVRDQDLNIISFWRSGYTIARDDAEMEIRALKETGHG